MKVLKYVFIVLLFIGCQSDYENALNSFEQHNFKEAKKSFTKVPAADSLYSKAQEFITLCNDSILKDSARTLLDKSFLETEKENLEGALKFLQALPEADFLKYNPKKEYLILQCKGAIEYKRKNYKLSSSYLSKIPKDDNDEDYYAEVKKLADSAKAKIHLWRKDSVLVMKVLNAEDKYFDFLEHVQRSMYMMQNLPKNATGLRLAELKWGNYQDEFNAFNEYFRKMKIPDISNDSVKIQLKKSVQCLKESSTERASSITFFLKSLNPYYNSKDMMDQAAIEIKKATLSENIGLNFYVRIKKFYTQTPESEKSNSDSSRVTSRAISPEELKALKKKYGY